MGITGIADMPQSAFGCERAFVAFYFGCGYGESSHNFGGDLYTFVSESNRV